MTDTWTPLGWLDEKKVRAAVEHEHMRFRVINGYEPNLTYGHNMELLWKACERVKSGKDYASNAIDITWLMHECKHGSRLSEDEKKTAFKLCDMWIEDMGAERKQHDE